MLEGSHLVVALDQQVLWDLLVRFGNHPVADQGH